MISLFLLLVSGAGKGNAQGRKRLTFYYIDHGTGMPNYPFWPVYYKGIADAAALLAPLGVEVKHFSAGEYDLQTQSEMLKQAVAANPDGLVTTMRDPKSFESILKPLLEKGIPIMAANVEDLRPPAQRIPYLGYYGEDSSRSGTELADALIAILKKTGAKKPRLALLISPVAGNAMWEARLSLLGSRLTEAYGTKSEKIVDLDGTQARTYLEKNPEVDLICAHESQMHRSLIPRLKGLGKRPGKDIYLLCFDIGEGSLEDIKSGYVAAAYDEQQYLQGYLPLFDLYLHLTKYKVHPVRVITGIIIDAHNVDSVVDGARAGYR
ncbi:MAG: hypothetical protein A2V99_06880 [Spirochaetes bacterium RBG_16_67_19]|nr:MAG: hypothetical protein A2V99_06880 [Spirochaetes bacterium RBG_16_67_19]